MGEVTMTVFEVRRRAWESAMRRAGRAESTLQAYGHFLNLFGQWLGDRDPAGLTKVSQLEEWLDAWEDSYSQRYGKLPSVSRIRTQRDRALGLLRLSLPPRVHSGQPDGQASAARQTSRQRI